MMLRDRKSRKELLWIDHNSPISYNARKGGRDGVGNGGVKLNLGERDGVKKRCFHFCLSLSNSNLIRNKLIFTIK